MPVDASRPAAALPRVSLCMIVRNEAARLGACLAAARPVYDECVIVDTGSTDGTVAVARALGARVVAEPWRDDFAAARNAALAHARGGWILVLDADELLPAVSAAALGRLVAQPPQRAYSLLQRSRLPNRSEPACVAIVRLFPRHPAVHFAPAIHETVNASLFAAGIPIVETSLVIEHDGYRDAAQLRAKQERNGSITEAAFGRDAEADPHLRYHFAATLADRQDWLQAALAFERCAQHCTADRPRLAAAARLQAAECWIKLGDTHRALPLLPSAPDVAHHPRALLLRAGIETERGDLDQAHQWYLAVLASPDVPHVPPVAIGELKFKALFALGEYWGALGRKEIGARIFRLALELQRSADIPRDQSLFDRYAQVIGAAV